MTDEPLRLWHGGAPGRAKGDLLLPPTQTGLSYTRLQMSLESGLDRIAQQPDLVYLTTDRDLAWAYASMWTPDGEKHGGGALYRVTAENLEPDMDLLSSEGVSFQTSEATVTAVYDAHVRFDQARCARIFQRVLAAHEDARRDPPSQ